MKNYLKKVCCIMTIYKINSLFYTILVNSQKWKMIKQV